MNPPAQTPAAAATQPSTAPATGTTTTTPFATGIQVSPPPARVTYPQSTVVQDGTRSPIRIVLTDMLYGGGAGALVGLGVSLIEQDNYARDVLIGAGVGLIAGGVVGGFHAYSTETGSSALAQSSFARDGLGTLARDRLMQRPMTRIGALTWRY